jgi:NADPH:quinone reductase-like Zn-dependent oxidoreductase
VSRGVVLRAYGGTQGRLDFAEVEQPGPHEVLIEVAAAAVNFPDLLLAQGKYQTRPEPPFVLGRELAGTVVALGAAAVGFGVGDRVLAQVERGAFAELVAVPTSRCFPIPEDLDFERAAALGLPYSTAYVALVRRGRYRPGETVLVTAAGGSVGGAAVQIAASLGARTIAVVRGAGAARRAEADGAADVVLAPDPASIRDRVHALTEGRGVDLVVESVGGETFAACLRATAREGRVVVVGFAGGEIPVIKAGHLLVKNVEVVGLEMHSYQRNEPDYLAEVLARILGLRHSGKVRIRVARRFPLAEATAAFTALAEGGLDGRVVLTVAR